MLLVLQDQEEDHRQQLLVLPVLQRSVAALDPSVAEIPFHKPLETFPQSHQIQRLFRTKSVPSEGPNSPGSTEAGWY